MINILLAKIYFEALVPSHSVMGVCRGAGGLYDGANLRSLKSRSLTSTP